LEAAIQQDPQVELLDMASRYGETYEPFSKMTENWEAALEYGRRCQHYPNPDPDSDPKLNLIREAMSSGQERFQDGEGV